MRGAQRQDSLNNPSRLLHLTSSQGAKANRKQLSLAFDHNTTPNRSNESVALHDAAVQSATSLMAVVNDMLQSPHVSAHLSSQQRSGLAPMYGRPRSRTAPSTPLVEAPGVSPVELPGSLLAGKKSLKSLHQSIDGKSVHQSVQSTTNGALGAAIIRPHSSPQQPTYSAPWSASAVTQLSGFPTNLYPPVQPSPGLRNGSPYQTAQTSEPGMLYRNRSSEDTLAANDNTPFSTPAKRPSLSVLQRWPPIPPSASTHRSLEQSLSKGAEAALFEQLARMRSSHEAHLASLREAHNRELDSHRSYIAFLEQRHIPRQTTPEPSSQHLTLDTTLTSSRGGGDLHSADASATTHQSFDSLESRKRASQEAAEAEALRRKLSLAKKAQSDSGELRRQRDELRHAVDRGDRRILQLKDIVRKSKDTEKTLKNEILDLESRLVAANNERTDVLEGFDEASTKVRKMAERERIRKAEIDDLRSRLFYANGRHASDTTLALPDTNTLCRPKHSRTKSDIAGLAQGRDPLAQQNSELRRLVASQEARIRQLEPSSNAIKSGALAVTADKDHVDELKASLYDNKKMLLAAREECERFSALLQQELRRQSRAAAQTAHTNSTSKDDLLLSPQAKDPAGTTTALLEREVQWCLKEIALYKLDIRGYKRDLKRAQAELAESRLTAMERPPTPDRDSLSSTRSIASSERKAIDAHEGTISDVSGLGISLIARPETPNRTLATATARALLLATPPPMPMSPPPPRPKTPMSVHKKLPKPPPASRTPSPLPTNTPSMALSRKDDTPRSLSESIISSYAKRDVVEDGKRPSLPLAQVARALV